MRPPHRPPFFLAIDQGTSSSRALLFDSRFNVMASAAEPLSSLAPRPGWSEQDAAELLRGQLAVIGRVLRKVPRGRTIAALGISNQRSTLIIWRRRDGAPVGPAVSWQDRRASSLCEHMRERAQTIRRRTGLRLSPHYAAVKLLWLIQENRSLLRGLRDGDLLCGTVNSFLIWHLTGGQVNLTDHTNAARMLLLNLSTLKWDPLLLSIFDLSSSFLPEVRPTFSNFGTACIAGRRISIRCSLGDQQAALLGQGCHRSGEASINYGTGGFFLLHTGREALFLPGLLTSIASSDAARVSYLLEGTVNAVGSLLEWTRQRFGLPASGPFPHFGAKGARSPFPVILIPGLAGLGAPHWLHRTPTVILDFKPESRPEDVLRAAMESIAFLMRDIRDVMRDRKRINRIFVAGGISRLDELLQFQSDLLQTSLYRTPMIESSARGAALGAAIGAGVLSAGSIPKLREGTVFRPSMERSQADRLYRGWQAALKIATLRGEKSFL